MNVLLMGEDLCGEQLSQVLKRENPYAVLPKYKHKDLYESCKLYPFSGFEGRLSRMREMRIRPYTTLVRALDLSCTKETIQLILSSSRPRFHRKAVPYAPYDNEYFTPLMVAIYRKAPKEVLELLLQDPRVLTKNPENTHLTPLHLAFTPPILPRESLLFLLGDCRLSVRGRNDYGEEVFAFALCANLKRVETVKFILAQERMFSRALIHTSSRGKENLLTHLVNYRCSLEILDLVMQDKRIDHTLTTHGKDLATWIDDREVFPFIFPHELSVRLLSDPKKFGCAPLDYNALLKRAMDYDDDDYSVINIARLLDAAPPDFVFKEVYVSDVIRNRLVPDHIVLRMISDPRVSAAAPPLCNNLEGSVNFLFLHRGSSPNLHEMTLAMLESGKQIHAPYRPDRTLWLSKQPGSQLSEQRRSLNLVSAWAFRKHALPKIAVLARMSRIYNHLHFQPEGRGAKRAKRHFEAEAEAEAAEKKKARLFL